MRTLWSCLNILREKKIDKITFDSKRISYSFLVFFIPFSNSFISNWTFSSETIAALSINVNSESKFVMSENFSVTVCTIKCKSVCFLSWVFVSKSFFFLIKIKLVLAFYFLYYSTNLNLPILDFEVWIRIQDHAWHYSCNYQTLGRLREAFLTFYSALCLTMPN